MKFVLSIIIALILTGCATPYQTSGFRGGVSATPLNDSVYEIRARGNGYTSASTTKDHALLKSAEICIEKGFSHFIPISSNQSSRKQTYTNNTYNTNCYGNSCTTTGGGSMTFIKPSSDMTIKLFKSSESKPDTSYSCSIIYNNLAPKYKKQS